MTLLSEKVADPQYDGLSSAELSVLLNDASGAESTPAYQSISKSDIREYLRVTGSWLELKRSTTDAAELAMDSLSDTPDGYDMSNATIRGALTATLDGVVADGTVPDFGESGRSYVLALGDSSISWAQANGVQVDPVRIQKLRGEI